MNWHTFIGGPVSFDGGRAVALDTAGNVFVAGTSMTSWGVPLNPHSGMRDIVVAKFDASGRLQWHTFLGGSSWDGASDLAVDDAGNLFLVGSSDASWGTPLHPYSGAPDIVVVKLAYDQGADPSQLVLSPKEGFSVFVDSDHRL